MARGSGLPRGVWVIVAFHVLSLVLWLFGQTGAVVSYDTVAEWGFQEPRALLDPVIVEVNRSIGLTDTIIQLPLFAVAAFGLIRRRFYGAVASWLVFGVTLYWPVEAWSSKYFYARADIMSQPPGGVYFALPGALFLFALWGSWYLARNRRIFT
jgi:hypothetical protein